MGENWLLPHAGRIAKMGDVMLHMFRAQKVGRNKHVLSMSTILFSFEYLELQTIVDGCK